LPEHPHSRDVAPSVQGVYDALRGGHRHRIAEEKTAAALEKAFPGTGERMLEEQAFTGRAAAMAARRGVRQFIVTGAGMPAPAGQNIHEAARAAAPDSVTAYVSADPYAAAWTRALLGDGDPLVAAVEAQVRCPSDILGLPAVSAVIDLRRPACVIAPVVLHFAAPDGAEAMIGGIAGQVAAGSVVAVSSWPRCPEEDAEEFSRLLGYPVCRHPAADIARWMTSAGLRIEPEPLEWRMGVVEARLWPDQAWAAGELGRPAGRIIVAVGVRE